MFDRVLNKAFGDSHNSRHITSDLDHSIAMNPCLLSCYNEEEQKFYLDKKIPNGERCHDAEHNICVYGKCQVRFQTFSQLTLRSSCPEVFCEKGILKNLEIFTRKQLRWSFFLIKLQAFKAFENIAKFFRTPILKNICEWLFLISGQ